MNRLIVLFFLTFLAVGCASQESWPERLPASNSDYEDSSNGRVNRPMREREFIRR